MNSSKPEPVLTPSRSAAQTPSEQVAQQTPQEIANLVGTAMYANDSACAAQKIVLTAIAPGTATMQMTVQAHMTNGHKICHGGFVFLLADSAFAYACNSFGKFTVASSAGIEFIAAAHLGDTLTAKAHAIKQGSRTGLYDITVTQQEGHIVAVFRGRSATIKGSFLA